VYDTVGYFGLFLLVFWGGDFLGRVIYPVLGLFDFLLSRV